MPHLADEETEGERGLLDITLLVSGRMKRGVQVSGPQATVLSLNQEASRSQVSKKIPSSDNQKEQDFGIKSVYSSSAYASHGAWGNTTGQSVPPFPYL